MTENLQSLLKICLNQLLNGVVVREVRQKEF